jgi:thiamine-monophosphate kinase
MGEFELIDRYFKFSGTPQGVSLGVGDDCALLEPTPGMQWVVSTDTLVQGQHFFPDVDPFGLGQKSLAVNLSDLAACGAQPRGFTLSLSLPAVDEKWLDGFAKGLAEMASRFECPLVGGDTTKGPLCIGITVMGEVPRGQALLRSGAQAGDDLYVSGTLGDARAALKALLGECALEPQVLAALRPRLESPTPRVALGLALRGLAHAAMDLSDGLSGDLHKMMKASGTAAHVQTRWILDSPAISTALKTLSVQARLEMVTSGGDDYELLFAAPKAKRAQLEALSMALHLPLTPVGEVLAAKAPATTGAAEFGLDEPLKPGAVVFLDDNQQALDLKLHAFDHFS